MPTAFFLGAGASRAAHYPLNNDLFGAIAWACDTPRKKLGRRLRSYLEAVHGVSDKTLSEAAADYQATFIDRTGAPRPALAHPSVVDILSLLDTFFAESSYVGFYAKDGETEVLHERELHRTRQRFVEAICLALNQLGRRSELISRFAAMVRPEDTIVTTNWDFLLDTALQESGTEAQIDYGTDALVVDDTGESDLRPASTRKTLLKLHGSLNWLTCRRCTRLYANPHIPIADLEFRSGAAQADWGRCHCGMRLSHLLMTPTFVKAYNNRHILNVWGHTIQRLAGCDTWCFIGYSLPEDDLAVRAMLRKTFSIRAEVEGKGSPVRIRVVGRPADPKTSELEQQKREEEFQRYKMLFGDGCERLDTGFEGFVGGPPAT